jgi:flavin reductase (DIM6/NTAB) family NADH-FMN oxidoreductase RutF
MDAKKKQKALQQVSNGMYVLTSRFGEQYGAATITWLTQISFKPPLLLAAIRPDSNLFQCLSQSHHVVIHILAAYQVDVARRFLTTTEVKDGLMNGEPFVEGKTVAPVLTNVLSYIEAQVIQIIDDGGDHKLVVMEVLGAEHHRDFSPLLVAGSPWKYGG